MTTTQTFSKVYIFALTGLLLYLGITSFLRLYYSFEWVNTHDSSYMYYMAWLISEHNYIPYKGILDTSFPGSYLIYMFLGKIFGHSSAAYHWADLSTLALLIFLTWKLLRPLGSLVATTCIVFYLAYYTSNPTYMHLQRDYLALIPIVSAIIILRDLQHHNSIRALSFGFLFGVAASIKPQLAIGGLLIFLPWLQIKKHLDWRQLCADPLLSLLGFMLCAGFIVIWLYVSGALKNFVEMINSYMPLYFQLSGNASNKNTVIKNIFYIFSHEGKDKLIMLFNTALPYLAPCIAGCLWLNRNNISQKATVTIFSIALLAGLYLIVVLAGGHLWAYHYMPFHYFALIGAAFIFAPSNMSLSKKSWVIYPAFRLFTVIIFLFLYIIPLPNNLWLHNEARISESNRANIALHTLQDYMKTRSLNPSEYTAQPVTLNTISYSLYLLQESGLKLTSRYPDCWFCYHNLPLNPQANPYITEFVYSIINNKPLFIITDRFFDNDILNNSPDFPNLAKYILDNYQIIHSDKQITIYARS